MKTRPPRPRRSLALSPCSPHPPARRGQPSGSPWWQLLTGSRPTNLQPAPDQSESPGSEHLDDRHPDGAELLVAPIEVGGKAVGCLGTGEFVGLGAAVCSPASLRRTDRLPGRRNRRTPPSWPTARSPHGPTRSRRRRSRQGAPRRLGEGDFTLITTAGRWVATPLGIGRRSPSTTRQRKPPTSPSASASSKVTSEGSGRLTITLTNLGNAPSDATSTPLHINDRLPAGAAAYGTFSMPAPDSQGRQRGGRRLPDRSVLQRSRARWSNAPSKASCPPMKRSNSKSSSRSTRSGRGTEAGEVTVSGGDAPPVSADQSSTSSAAPVPFGLEYFSMRAEEEGGGAAPAPRREEVPAAGSHPFQLTTTIVANSGPQSGTPAGPGSRRRPARPAAQPALHPARRAGRQRHRGAELRAGRLPHCRPRR